MTMLDDDGQPVARRFGAARINDRKIDELIGLCRGVLADGAVTLSEAQYMQDWLRANKDIANHWPANIIFSRIESVLADGVLDSDEERDLIDTLIKATGDPQSDGQMRSNSSGLPLCEPYPDIEFADRIFCFTGKFATGSRKYVEEVVNGLGASSKSGPSGKVHSVTQNSLSDAIATKASESSRSPQFTFKLTTPERCQLDQLPALVLTKKNSPDSVAVQSVTSPGRVVR
ncbi:hypothetical protein IMCC3135_33700 [Granulosicoccus antarcticus IMCC3135]|uniref:Uncharacterized protein n=1 Tax=Granulosicoccus antarcticus IMCC3135 TaxID=1192854 RepID=A0A2Z2P2D8_9GAMM|nr:hypothetical protein IMCC3135_33700 [Granulosicoccus antarcticus IMCC3135]